MSSPFQNRLVGTIIVAAAAIIFLPDIFDGERKAYKAQFEPIPKAPESVKAIPLEPLDQSQFVALEPQSVNDEQADDDALIDDDSVSVNDTSLAPSTTSTKIEDTTKDTKTVVTKAVANKAKPKPQFSENGITQINPVASSIDKSKSYVIQLGSFKHQQNVEKLTLKLKKSGYSVFTKPIKTSTGTLTKVFIGPQFDRQSLQGMLPELKTLTGVQGRVAQYSATN
ncbi:SPOR domain-containing protein [Thalassotalea aquiviva]|uniref:SPOR domain-containing protein n=1 Tax=Thalassotalea aquiviva TaxID=3242415 RepID=UPI00352A5CA7